MRFANSVYRWSIPPNWIAYVDILPIGEGNAVFVMAAGTSSTPPGPGRGGGVNRARVVAVKDAACTFLVFAVESRLVWIQ